MSFFSIVIPVYNVAPYLRECLDSVLAQTFTDWEAICVDDGSTDGSGAILDEYAAKDSRFRVFHQPNAGVSAARNKALDVAQGEWIWFVDADDVIRHDATLKFSNMHSKAEITYFGMDFHYEDSTIRNMLYREIPPTRIDDKTSHEVSRMVSTACGVDFFGYTWNKFVRRAVITHGGIRFEPSIFRWEDALFMLKAFSFAKDFSVIHDSFYRYNCRPTGLTHARNIDWVELGCLFASYASEAKYEGLRCMGYQRALVCFLRVRTWRAVSALVKYSGPISKYGQGRICSVVCKSVQGFPTAVGGLILWLALRLRR